MYFISLLDALLALHTAKLGEVGLWDFRPTKGGSKPTVGFPKWGEKKKSRNGEIRETCSFENKQQKIIS